MSELKQLLLRDLLAIPGVSEKKWQGRDDDFSSLVYKNTDFAHFHNNNELDLRLTAKIIKAEAVPRPANSIYHPNRSNNSPWIELRFAHKDDLRTVIPLVKLAIAQI